MPRIERYTTDEPVPVKQAQIISPDAFPFSTASAEALKTIGGVIQELAIRKREAADSLAINAAGESRDIAKLKMQQFMLDNPDPDTWEEGARKIIEEQSKVYSKQRFSPQVKASEEIEQQAFLEKFYADVQIASTVKTVDNAIDVSGKNLINKIANDDGSPSSAADIDRQMELYWAALLRKYDNEVALIHYEETLKEAEKAQIENIKKDLMDRAAARPGLMISAIDAELKERAKGKKGLDEFKMLRETELEAIRDYAGSVGEKAKDDSAVAVSTAVENAYANIIKGETDVASMIIAIQNDPAISDEDSNTAAVKIRTFFSTWHSVVDTKEEKIETSDAAIIEANNIKELVIDEKLSKDAALERYKELKKTEKINYVDNKNFIKDIFDAVRTAKDAKKQRINSVLIERKKQLRDAIEKQQNILHPDIATEILKDFANIAEIELSDKFRDLEDVKKEDIDAEVDRLIRKYTLSEAQQQMAVSARELRLAETLKVQQESITKIVAGLRRNGKPEQAKAIMDEAIMLGIFTREGEAIKKPKGKKVSIGKRLLDRLGEQFSGNR